MKKIKLKDSKFFAKVKELAPEVLDAVGTVFPPADKLAEIIKNVQQDKKEAIIQAYSKDLDAFRLEVEDRENAREMYKGDNSLQKIYALSFLAFFFCLTGLILFGVYKWSVEGITPDPLLASIITGIEGKMSSKIQTTIDFLFGGSMKNS